MKYQVWWVKDEEGVADFEAWFDSYEEADAYAEAHDSEEIQYVVLEEDEEFYFM